MGNPHKLQVGTGCCGLCRLCPQNVQIACSAGVFFICFTILEYFAYVIFKGEKYILFFMLFSSIGDFAVKDFVSCWFPLQN